jgi:hypothetical protein
MKLFCNSRLLVSLVYVKLAVVGLAVWSHAVVLRAESEVRSATQKAQEVLTDPTQRNEALNTPEAKRAHERVEALSGGSPQHQQEIYEISASILPILLEMAQNDPAKAQELLVQAQKDPKGFFERLPAAERKKIQDLASRLAPQLQRKAGP